jgi:hypothetical protein
MSTWRLFLAYKVLNSASLVLDWLPSKSCMMINHCRGEVMNKRMFEGAALALCQAWQLIEGLQVATRTSSAYPPCQGATDYLRGLPFSQAQTQKYFMSINYRRCYGSARVVGLAEPIC